MKTGTVIGRIVASKRLPELPAGALLEVQLDYPKDVVVCYDPLGCGIGERVMITIGAPAVWWFAPAQQRVVADALIIASLDNYDTPTPMR
ncbi:MAG TPA: EutN/CcmL family microcompartment protein [Hydrogenophaga sp.]|uniref:EutN/CcmL family microcompartment protein n=1 Tax=Hydrogenophaga sp. TaxID=1904254 RepID=UPI002B959662|nr:EutN/CcmL family microcompartment protein [Hydrogenophaga sp.]HMN94405.1 EutN/CcmL family microcompartment protein [Hydrogenophaga sp.]HMP11411.1 EutN/CcmL family microcompartment protein [Hydrogenophaga sp.]